MSSDSPTWSRGRWCARPITPRNRPPPPRTAQAAVVGGALIGLPHLLAPRRLTPVKEEPFECGKDPIQITEGRFAIKFSTIGIFFIIFDIEIFFVILWALLFNQLGWFGFVEMLVFLGILMLGFLYIWRKGGFEWE
ncbi:MAG: NADH-quinone oxidoreductase subunit A [Candidatus Rokuibacteriota bacterium]|nr:MAG: NADH-quinone oxidoreductase subunit A [Candidatus Rokubacteria bacterium]